MASLVRPYLYLTANRIVTSKKFDRPARVLQLLSHEGAVRRGRSQHLQALPNFRKCDLGSSYGGDILLLYLSHRSEWNFYSPANAGVPSR